MEAVAAAVVVADVAVDAEAKKLKNEMKSILFYSVSTMGSVIWLINSHQTFNPIALKGPDFLKFYLMLLIGLYLSILIGKFLKLSHSKTIFYFLIAILLLGITKLFRGLYLGKPVGYLVMILIMELIVIVFITSSQFNNKLK